MSSCYTKQQMQRTNLLSLAASLKPLSALILNFLLADFLWYEGKSSSTLVVLDFSLSPCSLSALASLYRDELEEGKFTLPPNRTDLFRSIEFLPPFFLWKRTTGDLTGDLVGLVLRRTWSGESSFDLWGDPSWASLTESQISLLPSLLDCGDCEKVVIKKEGKNHKWATWCGLRPNMAREGVETYIHTLQNILIYPNTLLVATKIWLHERTLASVQTLTVLETLYIECEAEIVHLANSEAKVCKS